MNQIMIAFTNMIENGYETGLVVIAVLAAGAVFQWMRVPRKYIYLLWILPFLRMMIPVPLESGFSFMPKETPAVIIEIKDTADSYVRMEEKKFSYTEQGEETEKNPVTKAPALAGNEEAAQITNWKTGEAADRGTGILKSLSVLWLAGIGALLFYSVISYIRFRHRLSFAVAADEKEHIYLADDIDSPFVLCGRNCAIYLPSDIDEAMKDYVISHEKEHIRRKDPVIKLIAYGICLVHWMNPFAWISYYFLGKNMELACDEAVIQNRDSLFRKEYAKALLFMSVGKFNLRGVPLAFAEGNPKERVEKIAAYKKPAFWAAAAGLIFIGILAVGLLSDPKAEGKEAPSDQTAEIKDPFLKSIVEEEGKFAKAAKVNLKASTGQGGSKLYYADEDIIIFGGYYGVFVFSKEEAKMIASVDLEDLGWEGWDEGEENLLKIQASADGNYILFSRDLYTYDYIYDWKTITMYPISKDIIGSGQLPVYDNLFDEGKGTSFMKDGEKVYVQLLESQSQMIGDLMYREYVLEEETREVFMDQYRHLFLEGRYKDLQAFEPDDLLPLVKAEMVVQGELRTVTDEKILTWLEDNLLEAQPVKGGTGCPFKNPLYLTRKDGNVGVIYPATDSCSVFRTENGNYYDYTPGYGDNSEFWGHFDGWLKGMYPDLYRQISEVTPVLDDAEYVDGAWIFRGRSFRYRLEVTGRMNNAVKDLTYVIVTNDKDITFEELFPLSGLASNLSAREEVEKDTLLIRIE